QDGERLFLDAWLSALLTAPEPRGPAVLRRADQITPEPTSASNDQVESLLRRARASLADYRLLTPPGDNAHDYFRQVLAIDPDNAEALAGDRAIANAYGRLARGALNRGRYDKVRLFVSRGLQVDPGNAELRNLGNRAVRRRRNPPSWRSDGDLGYTNK
ncbi:MAG: hypothetical protein ACFCBW_22455, partial [Candidatus Competibacterales bacterium]